MTKYAKTSGNALPLILGIVLLAALGFAGWMYMKKETPAETVDQALTAPAEARPTRLGRPGTPQLVTL